MMIQSKTLMIFRLLILVIQSRKLTITQKLLKLKRILLAMIIVIGILLHKNLLMPENFASRMGQVNLASRNDIATFVKKTDFDDKLKDLNKKCTSDKAKHIETEKKITYLTKKVALKKRI